MFRSLLIANRGEIACRIIRTARRMGIRTVAVYSEADAAALHAEMADVAIPIGPAPARESYLSIPRLIEAARLAGAEAVHPGYGFLSENADFAEACAAAGLVFVGPPAAAIRAMGSKSAAKALMEAAGVPLVPGYHGADQDPGLLAREAARIGYPVLIKASAGGGGKGMRVVETPAAFAEALSTAKGEAFAAFGDETVLVERYLTRPRHIEIQVFADQAGHVVSLFERDCSIQRRHQKVVEEAPAPGMTPERRAEMGRAACAAASAIGYVGAGTVEFIAEGDTFYFMEMNTRLQVEHPVTERITGLDLVEWQLLVAAGHDLPTQEPQIDGHAIEVRIYAEDPARDFMPSIGRLSHLTTPRPGRHVRLDTGVRQGDAITVHYDPMIAKLIVWDRSRSAAVAQLRRALAGYEVVGVATNIDLLRRIAASPAFLRGEVDTGFIQRHAEALVLPAGEAPVAAVLAAAAHIVAAGVPATAGDPFSPWGTGMAWRMNAAGYREVLLRDGDVRHAVRVIWDGLGKPRFSLGAHEAVSGPGHLVVDGVGIRTSVVADGSTLSVMLDGSTWTFEELDGLAPPDALAEGGDRVLAPMPGRIVSVLVVPGQVVARGQVLLVLEAMKVQMRLAAPRDGTVEAVHASPGTLVEEGAELVNWAAESAGG